MKRLGNVKNKYKITLVILFISVLSVITIFNSFKIRVETSFIIGDKYSAELSDVRKLRIRRGDGVSHETVDLVKINEFIDIIREVKFTKDINQENRTGWIYYIDLYKNKKGYLRITIGGSTISYLDQSGPTANNQTYYNIEGINELIDKLNIYFENFYD